MHEVDSIRSAKRAATLLAHPLRARILQHARTPVSAAELARVLGQPRQRVNYHVRQLARDGFLTPAGQQARRNMIEQQYLASALSYVITPEVLGELAPAPSSAPDAANAAQLLGLCARAQSEVAEAMAAANQAGVRLRTASAQVDVQFETAEDRAEFTRALFQALNDLVEEFGTPGSGRPVRVILGSYPSVS